MTDTDFARKQEMLRESNMNSINYANRAPMALNGCCCETASEITPPSKTAKRVAILVVAMVIGGIVLGMCSAGRAAERGDHMRPHEITLLLPPQVDRVNSITISGPYINRDKCEEARAGVTVRAPGAKLVCGIVNPWRVR